VIGKIENNLRDVENL